ncbi:MAG: ABC transporter substrate-binding protein [Pseudomonadota bacterium]|nr:ABC transporter substrate-binding protein [Pseudomonadota bacterium]
MKLWLRAAAALLLAGALGPAKAEPLKIGLLLTLSGPSASLGEHARDGFMLAVKELGGKLGGVETQVITVDDELKPDVALTKTRGLLERDKVDFVVGMIFSNVLQAVYKPVTDSKTFLIGVNAGTSMFAGPGCNPYFFSTSWENNQVPEIMGKHAQDQGHKRVVLMAPNYQAGKDATAGFRRHFKGEVVEEIYTPLGHADFSAELARIVAAKPDAVLVFMPGGMGINLIKQYAQAGLAGQIPFLSVWTVDETTLPATRDAAVGLFSGSQWTPELDNAANRAFVEAFEKQYGYVPSNFAAQAYDAAKLIDSAVRAAGGKLDDKEALRAGLRKAGFTSVRGDFRYNKNHFPIQDFYLVKAEKRADGKYQTAVVRKIFEDYADAQADKCNMSW